MSRTYKTTFAGGDKVGRVAYRLRRRLALIDDRSEGAKRREIMKNEYQLEIDVIGAMRPPLAIGGKLDMRF